MANFGPLTAEISLGVWGTPANLNGFRVLLCYCSNVAHWRPTKRCTMFVHLLGWCIIYTFWGAFASWQNFARCKLHFASKSCVLLYWQCYCTALQQRVSVKLCGMVQGMELQNFCRQRHLYLAGRPSRWASAHILVLLVMDNRPLVRFSIHHHVPVYQVVWKKEHFFS